MTSKGWKETPNNSYNQINFGKGFEQSHTFEKGKHSIHVSGSGQWQHHSVKGSARAMTQVHVQHGKGTGVKSLEGHLKKVKITGGGGRR